MARKKVNLARTLLTSSGLLENYSKAEALNRALCALHHWADAEGVSFLGASIEADRRYQLDLNGEGGGSHGLAHSTRYTGWDRRHDDNKAEGRPTGKQWSDDGVHYVDGIKQH